MKKEWKFCILVSCLLAIILLFGACGEKTEDETNSPAAKTTAAAGTPVSTPTEEPTPTPESTPTPTPEPTAMPFPENLTYTDIKSDTGSIREYLFLDREYIGFNEGAEPELMIDGDPATRWAYATNMAEGYEMELALTDLCYIDKMDITWFTETRCYFYELYADYLGGDDSVLVADRKENQDPRNTSDVIGGPVELFTFVFFANNENGYTSIHEIDVTGFCVNSEAYTIDEEMKTITIPAEASVEDFLNNLQIKGTYTAALGTTDGTATTVANGAVLKITSGSAIAMYHIITEG